MIAIVITVPLIPGRGRQERPAGLEIRLGHPKVCASLRSVSGLSSVASCEIYGQDWGCTGQVSGARIQPATVALGCRQLPIKLSSSGESMSLKYGGPRCRGRGGPRPGEAASLRPRRLLRDPWKRVLDVLLVGAPTRAIGEYRWDIGRISGEAELLSQGTGATTCLSFWNLLWKL